MTLSAGVRLGPYEIVATVGAGGMGEVFRARGNKPLLRIPGYISPGWLRIEPKLDPLRKNPRFQNLVASGK
jgi:hypothetical protein